jgi:hypothetical protein
LTLFVSWEDGGYVWIGDRGTVSPAFRDDGSDNAQGQPKALDDAFEWLENRPVTYKGTVLFDEVCLEVEP